MVADLHQRPKGGVWLWDLADWTKDHSGQVMVAGREKPVSLATAFVEDKKTRKAVDTIYRPCRAH
jgi:hypothetical protein